MALTDNIIYAFQFNVSPGLLVDSTGTITDLTNNNSVGQQTGKLDDAATFVAASSKYLSHASNADLQTGDIDFTVQCWVYLTSKGVNRVISNKGQEWVLYYNNGSDCFTFAVAGLGASINATTFGSPSLNTWYLVHAWHDSVNNLLGIAVNAGTADTTPYSAGITADTGAFEIGRYQPASAIPWDGDLDEHLLWKRVLTGSERTALYAGGAGFAYPFSAGTFTATIAATTGGAAAAATCTFVPPTFTATCAATVGGAAASATATATPPTFTATIAATAGGAAVAATSTFTAPLIFTATIAATVGGAAASLTMETSSVAGAAGEIVASADYSLSIEPSYELVATADYRLEAVPG